ncbi:MAG TPA: hypothetical protein VN418_08555 [Gammaproteobacteria bacterium]|nr:hypothetical protein [Gammaproteobacteria bacterium]
MTSPILGNVTSRCGEGLWAVHVTFANLSGQDRNMGTQPVRCDKGAFRTPVSRCRSGTHSIQQD